jgi:hypothetical protein
MIGREVKSVFLNYITDKMRDVNTFGSLNH